MARINRSEWSVNQQMAATPRTVRSLPTPRPTLPLSRVLGWMGMVVAGAVALSYIM
jgi:hypothetical protein